MEIRLGWPQAFIRLHLPTSVSAWRYCLRHPRSFLIGVYGFTRFIEQRDEILLLKGENLRLKRAISEKNERLALLGRKLSALKRQR